MVDTNQPDVTEESINSAYDTEVARPGKTPAPLARRTIMIFAVACGLVVANLYYAQPMLNVIGREFHSDAGTVGLVVTLTQVGYATGLLFLVPLGDLFNRRRLVVTVLMGATLALVGAALAPGIGWLAVISLAVGVASVVAQVLVPYAASLSLPAERGRVVGAVMSGLLIGILLARTFSGFVGQVSSWRVVYWLAAVLMLLLIAVLWRELPRDDPHPEAHSYGTLLRSVGRIALEEPLLRRRSVYGALVFAAFSVFWTTAAFLLSRAPYHYNQAIIGLFGLAGVAGALCASIAGRLSDRGLSRMSTGIFLLAALLSFLLLALGGHLLIPLIFGVVMLDLGVQGTHITNQSEIYRLSPEARSRLTTAYMVTYFVGGSLGSATSAIVYSRFGWSGVCLLGAAYLAIAFVFWLTELRPSRVKLRG